MSRIAEAFRKRTREAADPMRTVAGGSASEACISVALAWELHDLSFRPAAASSALSPDHCGQEIDIRSRASLAPPADLTGLVRRVLQHGDAAAPIRSLLFAPVDADVDSGMVCVGTALELTVQSASSVCLIDCNLQSSTLTETLGVPATRGLSDVLFEGEDAGGCLMRLAPNLWFLPRGLHCDEVGIRIIAEQMRVHLWDRLNTFDYVLLNSGPAAAQGDAALLGTIVDAAVLVVDAKSTRREAARRAARHLRSAQVNVVGAVLTNRTFPIPDALYRML